MKTIPFPSRQVQSTQAAAAAPRGGVWGKSGKHVRTELFCRVRRVDLARGGVLALPPAGGGGRAGELSIRVLQGAVWLTAAGSSRDIVLETGGSWEPEAGTGRIVLEALTASSVQLAGITPS